MASYHFSVKIIGRSDGRSAVAAAAYRAGELIERDETGDGQDYRRKGGVVSADILAPEGAAEWARDRSKLWNAVEARETRKNSQLAREIEVALPHELDDETARALVLDWARTELVELGMIVDVCIHDPEPGPGEERNRHAHILCTQRQIDEARPDGWAKDKNRSWNSPALMQSWRESWADAQNAALKAAGSEARVDHRSLEDQRTAANEAGDLDLAATLDRPPEPRMGVAASSMEDKARRSFTRRGEAYEPVTELGKRVAESRGLRALLSSGLSRMRAAVVELTSARAEPVDPFAPAPADDPFELPQPELSAPKDSVDDADVPSFGM